jgi:flagellin
MAIRTNTNTDSLNSLNALRRNQGLLSKAFERLSSGLRINSAADDAAGLSISSRFGAQIRGLNQAIRNTSDGVSLTQTADAALGNSGEALQRIRELAVQAANGTLSDADRDAIQSEVSQLQDELDRIGETTTFNGRKLLDGSAGPQSFQVGANANETVSVPGVDARSRSLGRAATVQGGAISATGLQSGELRINGVDIRATTATDDSASTANALGSATSVARAINDSAAQTGVRATAEAAEVTGGDVQGGRLDSSNQLIINGEAITGIDVSAGDAGNNLEEAINAASDETGVTAERDAGGGLVLRGQDGRNIDVQVTGNAGAITGFSSGTTTGNVTLTSDRQFQIGGTAAGDAGFASGLVGVQPSSSVRDIDVSSVEGANNALETVDRALGQVSATRSRYGALQNRFESTIGNLSTASENLSAANSRISDADFGQEAANLVRSRILGQANISVLAQANISGQIAIRLLAG